MKNMLNISDFFFIEKYMNRRPTLFNSFGKKIEKKTTLYFLKMCPKIKGQIYNGASISQRSFKATSASNPTYRLID